MLASQKEILDALDNLLKVDPEGQSAIYKSTFRKAVDIGAINEDGEVVCREDGDE